jgi:glycosyltransferase involved in cell wall biosynthesis
MIISVALCTYNGEKYIEQQLESIFSQSVAVSEIVICDDCSSDGTIQKVEKMSALHPGLIRLIVNTHNIGFRKNFEKALKECQGDFIFFCDQDDIWHPEKVKKTVAYLRDTNSYGVFTDAYLIDENSERFEIGLFECLNVNHYTDNRNLYPDLFTALCLSNNFVTGATIAITKKAKPILLPSWPTEGPYHDYYIALKLSAIGKLGYMADRLISYRIHPGQQIGVNIGCLKKTRLLDYGPDTDRYNFFHYLLYRRRRTLSICSECKFDKTEKKRLKNSYRIYIHSIIKGFSKSYRLKALLLYCDTELYITAYPVLKICWMRLHHHKK